MARLSIDRNTYISLFLPQGAMKVSDNSSDAVAYIYTDANGKPHACIFYGKQAKPVACHYYRNED